MGFGSVCLAGGLYSEFAGTVGIHLGRADPTADMASRDFVPMAGDYSDLCQPSQSH